MRPERKRSLSPAALRASRGFSIVSAIFLLVVLSTLGALMVTFSTAQHTTSAQDVQGSRAYQAARAGIEWGLYQLLQTGTQANPGCNANAQFVPGTATALGGTLSGVTVTVTCAAFGPYAESGMNTRVYRITATATYGGAPGSIDYIERQLQVTAER
jgi:MSHA biogenesis protein MshP